MLIASDAVRNVRWRRDNEASLCRLIHATSRVNVASWENGNLTRKDTTICTKYSLTAHCLLLTAYCSLLTAYCLLLTAYCLPPSTVMAGLEEAALVH